MVPTICIGILAYAEGAMVRDAVKSLLGSKSCRIYVLVSDRSEDGLAARSLSDLTMERDLHVRHYPCPDVVSNWTATGAWMMEKYPDADAFAMLAADDWWGSDQIPIALNAFSDPQVDVVVPRILWIDQESGVIASTKQPRYRIRTGRRAQLAWILRGIEAQPAHIVYGLYRPSVFRSLLERIEKDLLRLGYGADVNIALSIAKDFRLANSDEAVLFRRTPADNASVVFSRLGLDPPDRPASNLQRWLHALRVTSVNSWRVSNVLPPPWNRKVVRGVLALWWTSLSVIRFFGRKTIS